MAKRKDDLEGQPPGTESAEGLSDRHKRISEAAYYRAQQRGFTPGYEEEDWLAAEQEIDRGGREEEFHAEDNQFPSPK